jgi:hypothetical protein
VGPVVYPGDRTHSPLDETLVRHLAEIVARGQGRPQVFAKVGDSMTSGGSGVQGSQFLNCFGGVLEGTVPWDINIHLGAFAALAPTVGYFLATPLGAESSWTRGSLAARVGATAGWAVRSTAGAPSPLDQELAAITPGSAVVLFGANDLLDLGTSTYPLVDLAEAFEVSLRGLVDHLLERGVLPVLSTVPPRWDHPVLARQVPAFAGVVRALAQGRQVPLIDFNRELLALGPPAYGLGSDGVHPSVEAYDAFCHFDAASLAFGYTVRNLVTLQALDRLRLALGDPTDAPDPGAHRLAGAGTPGNPFLVESLPFGELRDLKASPGRATGASACSPPAPAGSPEALYRLVLTRPTALRVLLLDGGPRALRLSLWTGSTPDTCQRSHPSLLAATVPAGTYTLAVDAARPAGGSLYSLSITECLPDDPACR